MMLLIKYSKRKMFASLRKNLKILKMSFFSNNYCSSKVNPVFLHAWNLINYF